MAKSVRTETSFYSPRFEQARDELFSHILAAGLEAAPVHQRSGSTTPCDSPTATPSYARGRSPSCGSWASDTAGPSSRAQPPSAPALTRRATELPGAPTGGARVVTATIPEIGRHRHPRRPARRPRARARPYHPPAGRAPPQLHYQHEIRGAVRACGARERDAEPAVRARAALCRRAQQELSGGGEPASRLALVGPARRPEASRVRPERGGGRSPTPPLRTSSARPRRVAPAPTSSTVKRRPWPRGRRRGSREAQERQQRRRAEQARGWVTS